MSSKSFNLPQDSPFEPNIAKQINSVLSKMNPDELDWLSKHLNNTKPQSIEDELIIIYGTESGNAESLADQSSEKAKRLGFKTKVLNMADLSLEQFAKFKK